MLCLALQWKSLDQVHIPIPLQLSLFFNNNTAFSCLASQQDVPSTIPDSSESSDQVTSDACVSAGSLPFVSGEPTVGPSGECTDPSISNEIYIYIYTILAQC